MKRITPAMVSVLMLVIVALLTAAYFGKKLLAVEEAAPTVTTRNVPMAAAKISAGTIITEEHLGLGPVVVSRLAPDVLINNRLIVGRIAKTDIPAATPIRSSQLFQPGEHPPLDVQPGMRAVSVMLGDSTALVDGLIKPGQFVDVHLTVAGTNGTSGGLALKLFEGVRVIAINRNFQQGAVQQMGNNVTLELTPEQANILVLARERGTITLAFNPEGPGDGGVAIGNDSRATLEQILGLKPEPTPPQPFVAEQFRGSSRNALQFQNGVRIGDDNTAPTTPTPPTEPFVPPAPTEPTSTNNTP